MAGLTRQVTVGACSDAETLGDRERADHQQRLGLLLKTIESEIIPRLMLTHQADLPGITGAGARPRHEDVDRLAAVLLTNDGDAVSAFIQQVRARGVSPESIYLDLLTPAARLLGRMWEEDTCDFTAVTLGLWRLQRVMYELSPAFQMQIEPEAPLDGRRVLLCPVPGEQHTFGLFMVAEFFRRAGWEVFDAPVPSHAELVALTRSNWFACLGISLSCDRWLDELTSIVRDVQHESKNPGIGIIVGGSMFLHRADLVSQVGAHGTAADAARAVELAQSLLSIPRRIC
jgi:methanogenic corrinoid protein MtbC1